LARRLRTTIRQVKPDAVVLAETTAGPAAAVMDGGLTADFIRGGGDFNARYVHQGWLQATPTRYKRRQVNLFSAGADLGSPLLELNQVYAAGHNLALAGNSLHESKAYIKRLVDVRKACSDALVDGVQFDLLVDGLIAARRYVGTTQEVITIVSNAWPFGQMVRDIPNLPEGAQYRDASSGEIFTVSGGKISSLVVRGPTASDTICTEPDATWLCGLRILVRLRSGRCY